MCFWAAKQLVFLAWLKAETGAFFRAHSSPLFHLSKVLARTFTELSLSLYFNNPAVSECFLSHKPLSSHCPESLSPKPDVSDSSQVFPPQCLYSHLCSVRKDKLNNAETMKDLVSRGESNSAQLCCWCPFSSFKYICSWGFLSPNAIVYSLINCCIRKISTFFLTTFSNNTSLHTYNHILTVH